MAMPRLPGELGAFARIERPAAMRGGWPPQPVDLAHRFRDGDLALGADFLQDEIHRKQWREISRPDWLLRAGMDDRRQGHGEIGKDVVPGLRDLTLVEQVLHTLHRLVPSPTRES